MKSKFIYPTLKNTIFVFLAAQTFPFAILGYTQNYTSLKLWLAFELIILGMLCLWEVKPLEELDERERNITLKWKANLVDYSLVILLIPLITICLRPDIEAWTLYSISVIPLYILYVFSALMVKKDFGYFFIKDKINSPDPTG